MQFTNIKELESIIQKVKLAQQRYGTYPQDKVDFIFKQAASSANAERIPLAKLAVAEAGMGVIVVVQMQQLLIFNFLFSEKL